MTAVDIYGRQALHLAACSGQVHTLSYICDALQVKPTDDEPKAEVIAPLDARGFTPLHLAVYRNRVYCVRKLLRFKAYQELLVSSIHLFLARFINLIAIFFMLHRKFKLMQETSNLRVI